MNDCLSKLRKELKSYQSVRGQKSAQRFYKDKIETYGLKSSDVGKISKKYFDEVKNLPKKEVFNLCEDLFSTDMNEEAMIASDWIYRMRQYYSLKDFNVFENWIKNYINNWAKCDVFCTSSVGYIIEKYPTLIIKIKKWSKSNNLWLRRASAVSLIVPARKGLFLDDVFEISTILLTDKEDMVQKGYGWLLKVASHKNQKKVFNFVLKNKDIMPRTSLRYAIEKMPQEMRAIAMKK